MKIIHCADIHIGSTLQNIPADKSKIRRREVLDAFYRMIKFAKQNDVDAIIIAGDLFDKARVARQIKKEVLDTIASYPEIMFLYLFGNHDYQIVLSDHDLEVPNNLCFFDADKDWKYFRLTAKDADKYICIAGINVSQQSGYGFYELLSLDENAFNIVVLHGDLKTIQLDRLRSKNIDYLALGDIHIPDIEAKKLDIRGVYGYSGCLESRGFDECGERGFFLLDIQKNIFDRSFIPNSKRIYQVIDIDITGLDSHVNIDNQIISQTASVSKDSIIKIQLKGKRKADTHIERENLETKLCERFFYAKVEDQSILDMASVSFDNEISLRSEFINLIKQSDLDSGVKDKMLEYGIKALSGEAIET